MMLLKHYKPAKTTLFVCLSWYNAGRLYVFANQSGQSLAFHIKAPGEGGGKRLEKHNTSEGLINVQYLFAMIYNAREKTSFKPW